jgi:hypothetical protein
MSLLSASIRHFRDWISGATDFNGFKAAELHELHKVTASLPSSVQPGVTAMVDRFAANASSLGSIAAAPIADCLHGNADTQADQILAVLKAIGVVPEAGKALSDLEHAALATVITGMHATLDRVAIAIAHGGAVQANPSQPAS